MGVELSVDVKMYLIQPCFYTLAPPRSLTVDGLSVFPLIDSLFVRSLPPQCSVAASGFVAEGGGGVGSSLTSLWTAYIRSLLLRRLNSWHNGSWVGEKRTRVVSPKIRDTPICGRLTVLSGTGFSRKASLGDSFMHFVWGRSRVKKSITTRI